MRIASWNLNHRARQRAIPGWIVPEVLAVDPDVLVCTEYVEGAGHGDFVSQLRAAGLPAVATTCVTRGQNQVLIASRARQQGGALKPPRDIDKSVFSNALHVVVDGVHVIGFRMPAFTSAVQDKKRRTWKWVRDAAIELQEKRGFIVGDMNTERNDGRSHCGDCIEEMLTTGWSEVIPSTGYSWKHQTGAERRIDFGFASPAFQALNARYSWEFVGRNGITQFKVGVPDHALLVVDLE